MGLFDKFKREKPAVDWSQAHAAEPKFYRGPDGAPFGAMALTEGAEAILPKAPQGAYAVDGKPVSRWRMVAISTTKDAVLGDCEYSLALKKLAPYILDDKDDSVLVRGLSLSELETIPE
jgi:hypothetical protein